MFLKISKKHKALKVIIRVLLDITILSWINNNMKVLLYISIIP